MTGSSVVIVKPSSLGDIVHTLPAVHFLKSTFPLTDFFWIANSEWVPILQDNADLKGVIAFPRSRLRSLASFYQFLRWFDGLSALKPELVLDFQGLLRSAWISRSLKAKRVLGMSDGREASRYFYHQRANWMRKNTLLNVTWNWRNWQARILPGLFNFLCRKEDRFHRWTCRIDSSYCTRFREEPINR